MKKAILLLVVIAGLLAVPALPLSFAVACPTYTTTHGDYTFHVQVTGVDGSCPAKYSNAPQVHYVLSTSAPPSPYTVVLSDCVANSPSTCPPDELTYQGWGAGATTVCGSGCGSTITFNVDSTVQAGKACDTLNVQAGPGNVILILEAGVGGDCSGTTTTTTSTTTTTTTQPSGVPQFGAPFGMLLAIAIVAPMLLLLRKFSLSARN